MYTETNKRFKEVDEKVQRKQRKQAAFVCVVYLWSEHSSR